MSTSNKTKTTETAAGLPEVCASRNPADDSPVLLKRGEKGFWPMSATNVTPEECNKAWGITKSQEKAMLVGSMFGWNVPGADPANYIESGSTVTLH